MPELQNYLVTGGAGFIGSHLVEKLVSLGYRVRVIDDFSSGREENLGDLLDQIELIRGDIRDKKICFKVAEGMEVILHHAALASVPRSVAEPILSHEINVTGTLNLLLAAGESGVKSFVFASSSAVYGDDLVFPKKEGYEDRPLSPYAAQKLAAEKYCQVFSQLFGFNAVSLRYFNVFGPRQDPSSEYGAVIPIFITRMLKGQPPIIFGDGQQSRDFIYVENVVQANLLAAGAEEFRGEVFNIGSSERVTVNELAEEISLHLSTTLKPVQACPRPGDIRDSYADTSKAEKRLGFKPGIDFREGLKLTIDWYKARLI
jgi:UDP-glucose 4-epimerase